MIPVFFPPSKYVARVDRDGALPFTLRELCERAGVRCRASGAWTERLILLARGSDIAVVREPGDDAPVRIELPFRNLHTRQAARLALGTLAYGDSMDLVARASIRGADWSRPTPTPATRRTPRTPSR